MLEQIERTLEQINERNFVFFEQWTKRQVDGKCYDCEKWTIYGKTCNNECIKED